MWLGGLSGGAIRGWLGMGKPRGAAVPFETPALRMARVCEDERDGLTAILRDFANNGSTYIVPWNSLPLMCHHDRVGRRAAPRGDRDEGDDPSRHSLRGQPAGGIRRPGSRGEGTRDQAAPRRRVRAPATPRLCLILHLLNSAGSNLASLIADPDRRQATETRAAVAAAAKQIGVRREEIYQRTSELAKLLQPVGFNAAGGPIAPGWLRVLHDEVAAFGLSVASSAKTAPDEVAKDLAAVAEAARSTAEISGAVIGMIDYAFSTLPRPSAGGSRNCRCSGRSSTGCRGCSTNGPT